MNSKYAIVSPELIVLNIIVWDGVTPFDYGQASGNILVLIQDGMQCQIDWVYDPETNEFNPPPDPPASE